MVFTNLNSQIFAQEEGEIEDSIVYLVGSLEEEQVFLDSYGINEPRAVASMSKLMTYYLVMESIEASKYGLDTIVTVQREVHPYTAPGNSRMDLVVGEKISVKDLLDGLMIVSANDRAVCLSIFDSGSEEAFVKKMNDKAKELNLTNSTFVNSHGLEDKEGKSNSMSPVDLYKLTFKICKDYPEVLKYSRVDELVQANRDFKKPATALEFSLIPGFLGLKTGYTDSAGRCFTGVFDLSEFDSSKDFSIITIVMNASSEKSRLDATRELVKRTSENFHRQVVLDTQKPVDIIYDYSMEEVEIELFPKEDVSMILKDGIYANIKLDYDLPDDKYLSEGDYGDIILSVGDKEYRRTDLTVVKNIEKAGIFTRLGRMFSNSFSYIFLMLFG